MNDPYESIIVELNDITRIFWEDTSNLFQVSFVRLDLSISLVYIINKYTC